MTVGLIDPEVQPVVELTQRMALSGGEFGAHLMLAESTNRAPPARASLNIIRKNRRPCFKEAHAYGAIKEKLRIHNLFWIFFFKGSEVTPILGNASYHSGFCTAKPFEYFSRANLPSIKVPFLAFVCRTAARRTCEKLMRQCFVA